LVVPSLCCFCTSFENRVLLATVWNGCSSLTPSNFAPPFRVQRVCAISIFFIFSLRFFRHTPQLLYHKLGIHFLGVLFNSYTLMFFCTVTSLLSVSHDHFSFFSFLFPFNKFRQHFPGLLSKELILRVFLLFIVVCLSFRFS